MPIPDLVIAAFIFGGECVLRLLRLVHIGLLDHSYPACKET